MGNNSQEQLKKIQYTLDLTRSYHNLLEKEEENHIQTWMWDRNAVSMTGETGNGTEESFYLQDELGSPIRFADETGNLTETYGYGVFGEDLYQNQGVTQPFGYTGYQKDEISGTYFAQAREYLPEVGRFAGEDWIKGVNSFPVTLNEYGYCWNNPLILLDLTGLSPEQSQELIEGNEAHRLLELKFERDYGWRGGETEYYINNGVIRNISGTGRADIVYFNEFENTVEVYEIKPGSYAPGKVNYQAGLNQLDGYIRALSRNEKVKTEGWDIERGSSLDGYFDTIVIPSQIYPEKEIVYRVYPDRVTGKGEGIITYYYRKRTKEYEMVPVTEEEKEGLSIWARVGMAVGATVALVVSGGLFLDDIPSGGAGTVDNGIATAIAAWAFALYEEAFQSDVEESCEYN